MARYTVQAPDGRIVTLEGPDGAPPAEVIARAQSMYQPTTAPQLAPLSESALDAPVAPMGAIPFPAAPGAPVAPLDMNGPVSVPAPVQAAPASMYAMPAPTPPDQLRPRYEDPNPGMGPFKADADLGSLFADAGRNMIRQWAEGSGNIRDSLADAIDMNVGKAKLGLARLFIGDEELNRRSAEAPAELNRMESSDLTDHLRAGADSDFTIANKWRDQQLQNPIDREKLVDFQDVKKDPLNIPQTGRFAVETAVGSAPQMLEAMIPGGVIPLGIQMVQDTAENRAQNNGREVRDVTGKDLVLGAPTAIGTTALERVGAKGALHAPAKTAIGRVAKSTAVEAGTEAIQEPIQYAGESVGTDAGFQPGQALDRSMQGAIGGATSGGTTRATIETTKAGVNAGKKIFQRAPEESAPEDAPADQPPQAQQRPSQDTQQQAANQATSEPVSTPSPAPEARTASTAVPPTQPEAPAPTVQPTGEPLVGTKQPEPAKGSARKKVVTPDGGMEIDTEDEVVDLDSLQAASGDLQPRDRSRTTSDLQIQRIAADLDPERLGDSRTTDSGSPIVGPDNMVESGNGRTAAIRRAYEENGAAAERYRQFLRDRGYNIDGIKNPVLIRRRKTDLTPEDRARFTSLSNKSQIAELSSTEKARADAQQISDDMVDLHQGGEPDSQDNQDFIRAFVSKVVTGNETGSLIGKDKRLTQEGVKRAKAALVAKAYDDPDLVENIFESADPEVKAIGNVLRDRAPEYAQLGAAVRRGEVPERFDITKQLMEAVKLIRNARRDKKHIRDTVEGTNQTSMIEEKGLDPITEKVIRSLYRPGLSRMLSQPHIDRVLHQYARMAREQKAEDLFGVNKKTPEELLQQAHDKVMQEMAKDGSENQGALGIDEPAKKPAPAMAENADLDEANAARAPSTTTFEPDPAEVAKTGGKDFEKFSRNPDINVNKQVFEDAGHDPNKAVNYPPKRQLQIVVDQLKKKFDMDVKLDKAMPIKDQIDALADMYVGMNNMASTLGLPAKAMSLNGRVHIVLEGKGRPYLGMYVHNGTIKLPQKSNSFAHEWLHALDHYLFDQYGPMTDKPVLFSQAARALGITDPQNPVQSSFANLLNAMFFDKAELAAKTLELQDKAQNGRTKKVRDEAAAQLKDIESGSYKGRSGRTEYYKGARQMPNADYFASPHEMMARALEAYVGYRLDDAGVTNRGVSKNNLGYNSGADERLAKTFPKLQDRIHIFEAFDSFFGALAEEQILGQDASPDLQKDPNFLGVFDPKYWLTPETADEKAVKELPWLKRQVALVKEDVKRAKEEREIKKAERAKAKAIADTLNPKEPGFAGFVKRLGDTAKNSGAFALWNHMFRTERTLAHAIEKANPASGALRELNDRVFSRPGEGVAVKQTYSQAVASSINRGSTVLENLMSGLKRAGDGKRIRLTDEENQQLRNALLGLDVTVPEGSKLTKEGIEAAAAKLRQFADQQWKNMTQAGLNVGYYAKGAWLRRHYLKDAILADPQGFLQGAEATYKDQFDEAFGGVDQVMQNLDDFKDMVAGMLRADPQGFSFDKKTLEKLQKAIDDKKESEIRDIVEQIYDEVREQYARLAAQNWYTNLVADASRSEFESAFPKPGFMQKRGLPPSADVHLKDFMETNVERILFHYMTAANTAIAQQQVFSPKGKKSMQQLLKQARSEGVDADAIQDLEAAINRTVLGPEVGPTARRIGKFISLLRMGGILMNLNKIVFSAVVEPQVIALKTRDVRNSFRAYSDQLADMLKTNEGKYFQEVAHMLGAIGTDYADMMQQERFGGGFETGLLTRETMSKFFRYTGNTGITNIQSRVAIRAGYRWLGYVTDKYLNGTDKEKSMAARDLAELGIDKNKAEAFSLWLKENNGRPDLNAIANDGSSVFGADFMNAVVRFRDQAIQHPKKEDRPALANHPVGAVLYTGLGFTFSFWDNVVKAETKRVKAIAENEGGAEAAKVVAHHVATIGGMVVTTALINALRMAIFDHDKWEEKMQEDPEGLAMLLAGRALENTNLLGPAYSIVFNMYRGTEYNKDPATSLSGMVLSNYLNWLQKGMELGGDRNSPNNHNSEREFAKQTYRVMAAPALTAAMLHLPGPAKLLAAPIGVASMFINSNTTADKVADVVVGPKEKGGRRAATSEPKEVPEPKEPREAQ